MIDACALHIHTCMTSNSQFPFMYTAFTIETCLIADIHMGTGAVSSRPDQHNDRDLQWSICYGGFLESQNHKVAAHSHHQICCHWSDAAGRFSLQKPGYKTGLPQRVDQCTAECAAAFCAYTGKSALPCPEAWETVFTGSSHRQPVCPFRQ